MKKFVVSEKMHCLWQLLIRNKTVTGRRRRQGCACQWWLF